MKVALMFGIFKNTDDAHEFKPLLVEIEDEPLNPLGRAIFWIIVSAILFFSLWMFFGKVDVVVTSRGKIIPVGEVKTVQPLSTGVVRSILVQPGQLVEKGQVLMEIDPSDVDPELTSMAEDRKLLMLELSRLESLLEDIPFMPPELGLSPEVLVVQQSLYAAEKGRLEEQIRVKRRELDQVDQRLMAERHVYGQTKFLLSQARARVKRLRPVKDIISKDEWDEATREFSTHKKGLEEKRHNLEELEASRQRVEKEMDLIRVQERNRWLAELTEKREKLLYLDARIQRAKFHSLRQQIRSPVRGRISTLLVTTVGGVVTPAEKLAIVVPADSPLVIKALVLNKDIGFVAQGMDASIKVDTFTFQKYGLIDGTVLNVSSDSIEDEQMGLVYEAYIEPKQTTLMVEGKETAIAIGMGVTAEIKTGKRRIIEFFVYPLIKYLDEGISVR